MEKVTITVMEYQELVKAAARAASAVSLIDTYTYVTPDAVRAVLTGEARRAANG
jgi:hypothetical protein